MAKTSEEQARKVLQIDPDRLDEEWLGQPELYFTLAANEAKARRELETAKAELDLVEAEAEREIRSDPEEFGIEKVTESAIKSTVVGHPSRIQAQQRLIRARYNLGVAEAAKYAADHRKKALEKLVDLRLANYFSAPRAKSEEAREHTNREKVRRAFRKKQ